MTNGAFASWPLVGWVVGLSILVVAFVPYSGNSGNVVILSLASAWSVLVMFAVLLLIWQLVLERLADTAQIVATLVTFVIVGALRGLVLKATLTLAGVSGGTASDFAYRMVANSARMPVILCIGTMVVAISRRQRAQIAMLQARQAEVDAIVALTQTQAQTERQQAVDQVQRLLETKLAELPGNNTDEAISQIRILANDVVRPMSHELAHEIPRLETPTLDPNDYLVLWRNYWSRISGGQYIKPGWSTFTMFVFSLGAPPVLFGVGKAVLLYVLVLPVMYLGLVVARKFATGTARIPSPSARFLVDTGLILIAAVPPLIVIYLLVRSDPNGLHMSVAFILQEPVLVWLVALVAAVQAQAKSGAEAMAGVETQLQWVAARARLVRWHQNGKLARILHGPIQATLTSAMFSMRQAESVSSAQIADLTTELQQRLHEQITDGKVPHNIRAAVNSAAGLWAGVADIELSFTDKAEQLLAADLAARDLCISILQDAISNAVRHGKAQHIDITIDSSGPNVVELMVRDDGSFLADPSRCPGLGTEQVRQCAIDWQLQSTDEGVQLFAQLPVEAS